VLSESVAAKVLPLEGITDESGDTEGPFVFKPPAGAKRLDDLHLDKETFFLLIGALTQSNLLDANMALSVLCRDRLNRPALETLCVRLFSALKQMEIEKEKKKRTDGRPSIRSARSGISRSLQSVRSTQSLSARSARSVSAENRKISSCGSRDPSRERESVFERLARPVSCTPRDPPEFIQKLQDLSNTLSYPSKVVEEPIRKVIKSESEAKEIFNRLYCDAAKWKVRKRVYTELALMAEDAKVSKECPFQPAVRRTCRSDPSEQKDVAQRLYEDSKGRTHRREVLIQDAPAPSFRPETTKTAEKHPTYPGEKLHIKLHNDATKYRELRQNLNDYQLGECTFKPDTARSQCSGPRIASVEPIWRRPLPRPAPKVVATPKPFRRRPRRTPRSVDATTRAHQSTQSETEMDDAGAPTSLYESDADLAVCESPKLALRPTTTSDFAYDFLKEQESRPNDCNTSAFTLDLSYTDDFTKASASPTTEIADFPPPRDIPQSTRIRDSPQSLLIRQDSPSARFESPPAYRQELRNIDMSQTQSSAQSSPQRMATGRSQPAPGLMQRNAALTRRSPPGLFTGSLTKASTEKMEEPKDAPRRYVTQRQLSYKLAQPPDPRSLYNPAIGFPQRQISAPVLTSWTNSPKVLSDVSGTVSWTNSPQVMEPRAPNPIGSPLLSQYLTRTHLPGFVSR